MKSLDLIEMGVKVFTHYFPFLFALSFHEYAHGWMAKRKGDNTAEVMGRLTLNPTAHIDPIGTVALPLAAIFFGIPFFGWAKPVPVNPNNLQNKKVDMFWIALAGPLSNVLLAVVGAFVTVLLFRLGYITPGSISSAKLLQALQIFVLINLFLFMFNMLPLHPLDGGKILERYLPYNANKWLEDNQGMLQMVLIGVFIMGGFKYLAGPAFFIMENLFGIFEALL